MAIMHTTTNTPQYSRTPIPISSITQKRITISIALMSDVAMPPRSFPKTRETLEIGATRSSFNIPNSLSTIIDIPENVAAKRTVIATIPGARNSA